MQLIARDTRQIWVERFDAFLNFCARLRSMGLERKLARCAAERGRGGLQWITPREAVVAEALANLIVPADEETPGIEHVCVLGPSTVESLDRLIANSPSRQELYGRGLLAFDLWAQQLGGCAFAALSQADQTRLLQASQDIDEQWTSRGPLVQKAWRRFKIAIRGRGLPFSVGKLFPQLRNDCLQIFYTSRVSWIWLGYDGPPMDEGYPKLAARQETEPATPR